MGIINEKSIRSKMLILAIYICITFCFYRIVDISFNRDFVFNPHHEVHQNQMLGNTLVNSIISIDHINDKVTQSISHIDVNLTFDNYYGEDKGNLFYLKILLTTFIMIHLIFIQLLFLYVRRWLIKTNNILERYYQQIINYVHRKDGKKKSYPSYVLC